MVAKKVDACNFIALKAQRMDCRGSQLQSNQMIANKRRVAEADVENLALSNRDGPSKEAINYKDSTSPIIRVARKYSPPRKCSSSPSSRSSPITRLSRRPSSSGVSQSNATLLSTCSSYAGPQPTTADGHPLRSCLKQDDLLPSSSSEPTAGTCDPIPRVPSSCHRVSFSHVQLREYCRAAGDNPSVSSGCPLAIGWKYNKRGKVDIDSYEADLDKEPVQCQRISSKEREKLLADVGGVSHTQIMQGQVNAYFGRQLRAETLDQIGGLRHSKSVGPRERLYIMTESAARKLHRAKTGISHNQEQQKLWDQAHEAARRKSLG